MAVEDDLEEKGAFLPLQRMRRAQPGRLSQLRDGELS